MNYCGDDRINIITKFISVWPEILKQPNNYGKPPIHVAGEIGHRTMFQMLSQPLKYLNQIKQLDADPVMNSSVLLLQHIQVNTVDEDGNTPLDGALLRGSFLIRDTMDYVPIFRFLITHPLSNLDIRNRHGQRPVDIALGLLQY
jgi:ankyrin repeat protein